MKEFFVIQHWAGSLWHEDRKTFGGPGSYTEYPTRRAAFAAAEKVPLEMGFMILPMYKNVRLQQSITKRATKH